MKLGLGLGLGLGVGVGLGLSMRGEEMARRRRGLPTTTLLDDAPVSADQMVPGERRDRRESGRERSLVQAPIFCDGYVWATALGHGWWRRSFRAGLN